MSLYLSLLYIMTLNDSLELSEELKLSNQEHNNERRMIQINTYYSQKYSSYSKLCLKIIYMLMPIIIINIALKYEVLPRPIAHMLLSVIVGMSLFYIAFDLMNLSYRDNMNFDSYDWQYDIRNLKNATDGDGDGEDITANGCIDQGCCDQETQIYDRLKAKCILKNQANFEHPKRATEGSVTNLGIKVKASNEDEPGPQIIQGNVSKY